MGGNVFVTGMGIASGLGIGIEDTKDSLLAERTAIGQLRYLETIHKELPVAEITLTDKQMRDILNINDDEIITRTALIGIIALKEAIKQSNLNIGGEYRIAFISGTTVGGMEKSEQYYLSFFNDYSKVNYINAHDCGSCTESMADYFGRFDIVTTISTACSSAANAIILGSNMIKAGIVDAAVVGGSECLTKFHLNGFNALMILDKDQCRPFDETRAGLNLGEGAAYIVLESEKLVSNRKSIPTCKLSGYGNACDAYHQTASSPDGRGAILAMEAALKSSGLSPSDIDYINAHGTGTVNNDESEGKAISTLFAKGAFPAISSTKSYTGHTTSAAGGVEAVISIIAMNNGFIPPNLNHSRQMASLPFVPINKVIYNVDLKHVLSNSFGFGGNNSSLVFSKL